MLKASAFIGPVPFGVSDRPVAMPPVGGVVGISLRQCMGHFFWWFVFARMFLQGLAALLCACFRVGVGGCRWALMESLILAQDERWRRA